VEVQGAEAAWPWLERAGATFPTVVDSANILGEALGYKAIPNGILLDEAGAVRFRKFGGFSVANREDVQTIERLLSEPPAGGMDAAGAAHQAASAGRDVTASAAASGAQRAAALQRGLELLRRGDKAGALAAWREVLAADPENYVVRKQIWAVEHPEKFYPTIDWAWQKEQLACEREQAGRTG
jgi:hypothetical protein